MYIDFNQLGKVLILAGIIIAAAGLVILLWDKIPFLGKLPGDIIIKNKNFTLYFPIVTSILLSIIITLIFYLFRK